MAVIPDRASNTGAVLRDFKSLCLGLSRERCKIVTIADHCKIVCPLFLAVIFISLVPCQPQLTPTARNLPSSSSTRLKECVLPPTVCYRRRRFARRSAYLQVPSVTFPLKKCGTIVMTRSPVKSSVLESRPATNVHPMCTGRRHINRP